MDDQRQTNGDGVRGRHAMKDRRWLGGALLVVLLPLLAWLFSMEQDRQPPGEVLPLAVREGAAPPHSPGETDGKDGKDGSEEGAAPVASASAAVGSKPQPEATEMPAGGERPGGVDDPRLPVVSESMMAGGGDVAEGPPLPEGAEPNALRMQEISLRFQQGVVMLHAKRWEFAQVAFERVLQLSPHLAEAWTNLGFAHLGGGRLLEARMAFARAIDINPGQANAYYGLGAAEGELGDLESGLGAMRSFLHLTKDPGPENVYVKRARSALWEWESQLGRGPWGPTRGVPPGWKAEELLRDGTGVGVRGMKRGETVEQARERNLREARERAGETGNAGTEPPAQGLSGQATEGTPGTLAEQGFNRDGQ